MRSKIEILVKELLGRSVHRNEVLEAIHSPEKDLMVSRADSEGRRLSCYIGRLVRAGMNRDQIRLLAKEYAQWGKPCKIR